jgi:hypothetical protein
MDTKSSDDWTSSNGLISVVLACSPTAHARSATTTTPSEPAESTPRARFFGAGTCALASRSPPALNGPVSGLSSAGSAGSSASSASQRSQIVFAPGALFRAVFKIGACSIALCSHEQSIRFLRRQQLWCCSAWCGPDKVTCTY